jgi:hypothetical protein
MVRFNEPDSIVVARAVELNEQRLREFIAGDSARNERPARRRPGRVVAVAGALACAVLLVGIVLSIPGVGGGAPPTADPLTDVAARVSKLPNPAAMTAEDSYYTDTRSFTQMWVNPAELVAPERGQKGWIQFGRSRLETWISTAGGLRTESTPKAIAIDYPTAEDRKNAESVKGGAVQGVSLPLIDDSHPDRVFTVGDEHLDYATLTKLPSEPAALKTFLLSTIESSQKPDKTADVMRAATALLGYPLQSDVRAAIFTVIAGLPGVKVRSGVEDALGRRGDAIAWIDGPIRYQLIFDPNTGVDLENSTYLLKPKLLDKDSRLPAGALESRETIAARGVVDDPHGKIDPIDYAGPIHVSARR